MATLYENLQGGAISDNPLTSGATTVNSAAFEFLPTVTAPDVMYLTLDPEGSNGAPEIVKVTAHTASATSVTVVRAQQGTSARSHPVSSNWVHALTDADIGEFLKSVATADIEDEAVTTAKLADDSVTAAKLAFGAGGGALTYHASLTQTITTVTNLTIDTETVDVDGIGSVGSAFLTPPDGLYIMAYIWDPPTTGGATVTFNPVFNHPASAGSQVLGEATSTGAPVTGAFTFVANGGTIQLRGEVSDGSSRTVELELWLVRILEF